MELVAALCLLVYVVTTTIAGARLAWVGRRPGRRPELLLGAGSLLIGTVGLPISLLSGFGGEVRSVDVPTWTLSELVTQVGIVCLYGFVQQVFRPGVGWARAAVGGAALVLPILLAAANRGLENARPDVLSVVATGASLLACQGIYAAAFVWSALEGLAHYRAARRRLALGLAEPVVVNRYLLFAIFGVACTGITFANALAIVLEVNISTSLVVVAPSALLSLVAAGSMYLAILPPAWFLARVRGALS